MVLPPKIGEIVSKGAVKEFEVSSSSLMRVRLVESMG